MSDDIIKYRKILQESDSGANLHEIAKHMMLDGKNKGSVYIDFQFPVNDAVGKRYTVTSINMYMNMFKFDTNVTGLDVLYELPENASFAAYEKAMSWFGKGNYTAQLNAQLRRAGFSAAASAVREIFAISDDEVNYDAPGVEKELRDAAALALDETPADLIKKFSPLVLLLNIKFSQADIESVKHDIIKHILVDVKANGKTHNNAALVSKLIDSGVQWPELAAIKRSLDSL